MISESGAFSSFALPVPQHMQRALGIQLLRPRGDEQAFQATAVELLHLLPQLGLGLLEKREYLRREQRPFLAPLRVRP